MHTSSEHIFLLLQDGVLPANFLVFILAVFLIRQLSSYFIVALMMLSCNAMISWYQQPLMSWVTENAYMAHWKYAIWYGVLIMTHIGAILAVTRLHYVQRLTPGFSAYVMVFCYFVFSIMHAARYIEIEGFETDYLLNAYLSGIPMINIALIITVMFVPFIVFAQNVWVSKRNDGGFRKWSL